MQLNSTPLSELGFKHGDFVKFKYKTIVYNQEKGLPMYRDVEQYGWLSSSNTINGKVHIRSTHDHGSLGNTMSVSSNGLIQVAKWNGNIEDFPRTTVEGFQVNRPNYDHIDPDVPRYAGGDIPIRATDDESPTERIIPYNKSLDKKKKKDTSMSLDEQIAKQKALIMGKVIG